MTTAALLKSRTTGKIHRGPADAAYTYCNYSGQRRRPVLAICDDATAARASDATFCAKCFPNGRPL